MCRRRFSRLGKKLPAHSFGMASSRASACVVPLFSRCPLRQVARVSVCSPLGADLRGGLRLDQFLQQSLGDLADEFKTIG